MAQELYPKCPDALVFPVGKSLGLRDVVMMKMMMMMMRMMMMTMMKMKMKMKMMKTNIYMKMMMTKKTHTQILSWR